VATKIGKFLFSNYIIINKKIKKRFYSKYGHMLLFTKQLWK
jgi:hypothetical protein